MYTGRARGTLSLATGKTVLAALLVKSCPQMFTVEHSVQLRAKRQAPPPRCGTVGQAGLFRDVTVKIEGDGRDTVAKGRFDPGLAPASGGEELPGAGGSVRKHAGRLLLRRLFPGLC